MLPLSNFLVVMFCLLRVRSRLYIFINIWGRIAFGANKQNMSTGIEAVSVSRS